LVSHDGEQGNKFLSLVVIYTIMSQRLGMADGRCFSLNSSSQLVNNYIMQQANIRMEDNYAYRQLLQKQGPSLINNVTAKVQGDTQCNEFHTPLVKVKGHY